MTALCTPCLEVRDQPTHPRPASCVHPEHGKRDTWDVRGERVCPTCSTRWRARNGIPSFESWRSRSNQGAMNTNREHPCHGRVQLWRCR